MISPPIYEFADVRVDLGRMVVLKDGQPVAIEPKTFDVLRFLIEHRDRVVMKEELLDAVWRDTFVTPNVLTRAVAQLRKAIGDDARESRYIETVATRGYRFIAPVVEVANVAAVADAAAISVDAFPETVAPKPSVVADARVTSKAMLVAAVAVVVGALGVAAWFIASSRGTQPAGSTVGSMPEVRRLVGANGGYFSQPSLSPDGQAVAYVSDKSGPLEIYVSGLAPGSREIAITNDGQQNTQPAWSPDGQWIAYQSRRGGIRIVPATGGTPRQLAEAGSEPAWSPDSQQLVYASYAGSMAAQGNLWIVRRDGSERRALTQIGTPNGGQQSPTWSHDGRFVAFVLVDPTFKASLWLVSVADGQLRQLKIPGTVGFAYPRFAIDDRTLYWAGTTQNSNERISKVALTDTFDVAGAPIPILAIDGIADGLSIARDGRAAYGRYSEDSNLWAIDVRDGSASRDPIRLTNGQRSFRANYSATGRLAYTTVDTGNPPAAWTMKDDGTDQQPLVTDFPAIGPQWVGDGSKLLVGEIGARTSQHAKLWWVDAATRRTTAIAFDLADAAEPRISPDGNTLAFHVIEPSGAIHVWSQPLSGGPRKQITSEVFGVSYPNWSRDGKWLSVEIVKGNDTQVGFVSSAGGRVEQLTDDHGQSWPNAWSPDAEWIVYAGERANVWNLWTVSRRTRQQHQLTHFTSASGYVRWPVWSPHGDRIVFERNVWTGNVWLTKLP